MEVVEFLKISRELLKKMSAHDLRMGDYRYVELYEEYVRMRNGGEKADYVLRVLSERFMVSESTIKRIVRRFSKEVR